MNFLINKLAFQLFSMFTVGPNYTKLKTNLRLAMNRLKLLGKKKSEMGQKARKEIADLITQNKADRARIRVEQIILEDYSIEAFEFVEILCDLLLTRFDFIQQMKTLDSGLEEAVNSLLWASPRLMTEVPELKVISDQLAIKYGRQFVNGCRENKFAKVNCKLLQKLSIHTPSPSLVEKYMIEIAKSHQVPYTPDERFAKEESDVLASEASLIDLDTDFNKTQKPKQELGWILPPSYFENPGQEQINSAAQHPLYPEVLEPKVDAYLENDNSDEEKRFVKDLRNLHFETTTEVILPSAPLLPTAPESIMDLPEKDRHAHTEDKGVDVNENSAENEKKLDFDGLSHAIAINASRLKHVSVRRVLIHQNQHVKTVCESSRTDLYLDFVSKRCIFVKVQKNLYANWWRVASRSGKSLRVLEFLRQLLMTMLPESRMKAEADILSSSPEYKAFEVAVDKSLKLFDFCGQWVDMIVSLDKLIRLLTANSKFGVVPRDVQISKQLTHCLHPSLPLGVHLKVLDCYEVIFDLLGEVDLAKNLHLYASGLFSLFSTATVQVKRELLKVYEKHFIPLGIKLLPALCGFLNSVLPAAEEGSEFFDKCLNMMGVVCDKVGPGEFFTRLWYCVITTPSIRLPALQFMRRKYRPERPIEDQMCIIGNDLNRMRRLLDFVLAAFPLHTDYLLREDVCRLVQKCIFVLLSEDLTLNRRLFTWLCGSRSKQADLSYFRKHAKDVVLKSLDSLLEAADVNWAQCIRTVDLLLSLFERPLLSKEITDHVLLSCLLAVERLSTSPSENQRAGCDGKDLFFQQLDILLSKLAKDYIWNHLITIINQREINESLLVRICRLMILLHNYTHMVINAKLNMNMRIKLLEKLISMIFKATDLKNETVETILKTAIGLSENLKNKLGIIVDEINTDTVQHFGTFFNTVNSLLRQLYAKLKMPGSRKVLLSICEVIIHVLEFPLPSFDIGDHMDVHLLVEQIVTMSLGSDMKIGFHCAQMILYFINVQRMDNTSAEQSNRKRPTLMMLFGKTLFAHTNVDNYTDRIMRITWNSIEFNQHYALSAGRVFIYISSLFSQKCESFILKELSTEDPSVRAQAASKYAFVWSLFSDETRRTYRYPVELNPLDLALLAMISGINVIQHDDLPCLLQVICMKLADPASARFSVQQLNLAKVEGKEHLYELQLLESPQHKLYHLCMDNETNWTVDLQKSILFKGNASSGGANMDDELFDDGADDGDLSARLSERLTESVLFGSSMTLLPAKKTVQPNDVKPISPDPAAANQAQAGNFWYHPLHAHLLLYRHWYDPEPLLHAYNCLTLLLRYSPANFAKMLLSTPVFSGNSGRTYFPNVHTRLTQCLKFHRLSISGRADSKIEDGSDEDRPTYCVLYMDVLLTFSTYILRSMFINNPTTSGQRLRIQQLGRKVKIACLRFLTECFVAVDQLAAENGSSLLLHLADVLDRCKVQKCILHLLMATVFDAQNTAQLSNTVRTFSEAIVCTGSTMVDSFSVYQHWLLRFVQSFLRIEHTVSKLWLEENSSDQPQADPGLGATEQRSMLAEKRLFASTILKALQAGCEYHEIWLRFVVDSVPFLGSVAPLVVVNSVEQALCNVESAYCRSTGIERLPPLLPQANALPTSEVLYPENYVHTVFDLLTVLLHSFLLDSVAENYRLQAVEPAVSKSSCSASAGRETAETKPGILQNLFKAFNFNDTSPMDSTNPDQSIVESTLQRWQILSAFPNILFLMSKLWNMAKRRMPTTAASMRSSELVLSSIIEFLSPLVLNFPTHLLSSFALVFSCRDDDQQQQQKHPIATSKIQYCRRYSETQYELVAQLLQINVLPLDSLIKVYGETIRHPISVKYKSDNQERIPLEILLLQMVHCTLQTAPLCKMKAAWTSVCELLLQCLQMTAYTRSKLLLFEIFTDAVFRLKSEQNILCTRDCQDVALKLVNMLNEMIAKQLEQPYWLKRTFVVKIQEKENVKVGPSTRASSAGSCPNLDDIGEDDQCFSKKREFIYCQKAIALFSKRLMVIVNHLYKSEDAERRLHLCNSVWINVVPFLKAKNVHGNRINFENATSLLSQLTQHSQVFPTWRKTVFEVFMDASFFKMSISCLKKWTVVIDHLRALLNKDIISRIFAPQSLFLSKEQEYELRAAALRRLSFLLLSGAVDQYVDFLNEIQERIAENLRLSHVPHIYKAMFICFRALVIRVSSKDLPQFWYAIINEIVQVLNRLENHIEVGSFSAEDYRCAREDQWLQLYLHANKLLCTLILYSSVRLPEFQMYEWMFYSPHFSDVGTDQFWPFVKRIVFLLRTKLGVTEPTSFTVNTEKAVGDCLIKFLNKRQLSSLTDLSEFYFTLCNVACESSRRAIHARDVVEQIELSIYNDLAET
ncbi:Protein pad-1 [Trichinella papuae]|uniref:IST1 homolog n=1 Tax=Trichinella papuae TaxID=268474 RepID=A0A0V1MXV6_9BILA|nr:Protein pad-1 [Trichinella papuae]